MDTLSYSAIKREHLIETIKQQCKAFQFRGISAVISVNQLKEHSVTVLLNKKKYHFSDVDLEVIIQQLAYLYGGKANASRA